MDGFVAVTDPSWCERLASQPGVREANFWRPSTRRFNLVPGTPFFFKLKAPHHAIAGFGTFVGFTVLPDWLAWDTFGEANGVADLEALRARLHRIREGARIEADPLGQIGCCLIAETTFFPPALWVTPPDDWSPRTQTGATYSLESGEGQRIWHECLGRTTLPIQAPQHSPFERPRFGAPTLHRPRLGQGIFRVQVLDAYSRACAVTQEHSLPVLEAAHIRPYARGGEHDIANGLALRTDMHRLLDRGYLTIDEDLKLVVGKRLRQDFANGRSYYAHHGQLLHLPAQPHLRPAPAALAWHREQVFLG